MNGLRRTAIAAGVGLTLLVVGTAAAGQVSTADFHRALLQIPLSAEGRIAAALELGLRQEGFPADDVLRLIERLGGASGPAAEKEAVLLTISRGLEEGLPIDALLSKAFEGMARGVPLSMIDRGLSQRLTLLVEVRDLLYSKGVFGAPERTSAVASALPILRFNALISNIAGALGDYLEGGGSPLEGHILYREVRDRLTMLRGVTLAANDVELVLSRIEPADLARVALATFG